MNIAAPDAMVTGYEKHLTPCQLPDLDDCHVLAAAIKSKSQLIVTQNRIDFPLSVLQNWSIVAVNLEEFFELLIVRDKSGIIQVFTEAAADLKNPPMTPRELAEGFAMFGVTSVVELF